MIYAWDNYPLKQFPGLWRWLDLMVQKKHIALPSVAFDEVRHKTPDCVNWLEECCLKVLEIESSVLQEALRIKGILGIINDDYHPKGVDENDLLIIASARAYNVKLVSDESRQPSMPNEPRKYKIPAVCKMSEVNVNCLNFLDFIKNSEQIFR